MSKFLQSFIKVQMDSISGTRHWYAWL